MRLVVLSVIILVQMDNTSTLNISGKAINNNTTRDFGSESSPSILLSRRKRFLVFPEGSSFQLVFCTQNHGYLQIGDVVWFGNTAALAWELPADPEVFSMFKDRKHLYENRRSDSSKHKIIYVDGKGKFISEVPYKRRPIENPAFAKRSVEEYRLNSNIFNMSNTIKIMHERKKETAFYEHLERKRVNFHVNTRIDFYRKLQKLLDGLRIDGRVCVLRLLCETGKGWSGQGTFLVEILRVVFTLPRGREFDSVNKEYDFAHGRDGECSALYPHCGDIL